MEDVETLFREAIDKVIVDDGEVYMPRTCVMQENDFKNVELQNSAVKRFIVIFAERSCF